MGYADKFEIFKNKFITQCKETIKENWLQMFDMWLRYEAEWEFPYIYKQEFNKEFSDYMKPNIETLLWNSGKNIVFSISAYMLSKKDADLDDILNFTENFLLCQLDDFDNWSDDIGMDIYEESSDCNKRDNAIIADNSGNILPTTDISSNTVPMPDISSNTLPMTDISSNASPTIDIRQTLQNLPKQVKSRIKSNITKCNYSDITKIGRRGTLTYDEFIEKIIEQDGKCYTCLQELKYDGGVKCCFFPSADRIDNSGIHCIDNIAASCYYCNIRVWMRNRYGDFYKICKNCNLESHSYKGFIGEKNEDITFVRWNGFRKVKGLIESGLSFDDIEKHRDSVEFLGSDWNFTKSNTIRYIISLTDIEKRVELINKVCEYEDKSKRIFV
jgi:hypothetical protein